MKKYYSRKVFFSKIQVSASWINKKYFLKVLKVLTFWSFKNLILNSFGSRWYRFSISTVLKLYFTLSQFFEFPCQIWTEDIWRWKENTLANWLRWLAQMPLTVRYWVQYHFQQIICFSFHEIFISVHLNWTVIGGRQLLKVRITVLLYQWTVTEWPKNDRINPVLSKDTIWVVPTPFLQKYCALHHYLF